MKLKVKSENKEHEKIIRNFKKIMSTENRKWLLVSNIDKFEFDLLEIIFGK